MQSEAAEQRECPSKTLQPCLRSSAFSRRFNFRFGF